MKSKENIYFVGPMGAGKTTIGRAFSSLLNKDFYDTDQEIEKRSGARIPWIFDVEGESGFRDRESAVIQDLTELHGVVLATGGGAVLRPENRHCLSSRGLVVYLKASIDDLLIRTGRDNRRPLLQVPDRRKVLGDIMALREPLYEAVADIIVVTGRHSVKEVVTQVQQQIEAYLAEP